MLLPSAKRSASALYGDVLYTGQMSFSFSPLSKSPAAPRRMYYTRLLVLSTYNVLEMVRYVFQEKT